MSLRTYYLAKNNHQRIVLFLNLLIIALPLRSLGQASSITEQTQTIKTYPFSDPNPVPSLAINDEVARFYPYFMFNGYTKKSVSKKWKVIKLENPFIKVYVLPQVGGKVWGAIEKSTGKEFIYLNHVLKFRAIGIRGPWTSGGIEHNFGLDLGHAPWTAAPVDYITKKNGDGSVSCIVGGLDLASRTQWRVEIRLPKDKAYFKTKSLWYNPTPLHDAYLAWENAAFKATDGLQFYYPGDYYIYHSGAAHAWPIDKAGHNLSMYKENNFGGSKSYHVVGTYNNWYGGYWHNTDFGFGHWALYSDAPGKKIWIWSLARQGAIWDHLLTDNDGQYIEAQAGVKLNQAGPESGYHSPFNQLSLRPNYAETKTDLWFPVKNTGGMSDSSPYGTLNVTSTADSIKIAISPTAYLSDSLVVSNKNDFLYTEKLHLKPMQSYHKTVSLKGEKAENIQVRVGKNKLSYTLGKDITNANKIDRPVKTTTHQDYNSAERLFRLAEDENSMREFNKALADYLACLKKEPTQSRALSRVAELYYRKAQYQKGAEYARKALENNTYDPDANYIYGTLQQKMHHLVKAEEAFSIAARSMEYRSGAYAQIAVINIRKQAFDKAIIYAKKALDYNKYNLTAYELLGTSYRKLHHINKANKTFKKLLNIDPLNHYARFEQYLLQPSSENLSHFKSLIRNEFPHETYLELSLKYVHEGLNEDAIRVLKQAPAYPTVYYWLAYLEKDSSVAESNQYLKQAINLSPDFVFPFRLETIPVLAWARQKDHSWKTSYYLGLLYWSKLRTEKAKELFTSCNNTPDYALFYLSRGILFQNENSDNPYVLRNFNQALKLNSNQWRIWDNLSSYFLNNHSFAQGLSNSKEAYHRFPHNPIISLNYARALYNANKYKKALNILKDVQVLPQEHARKGHDIYEEATLSLALENARQKKYKTAIYYINQSKKWPENLGEGKPYSPDTRLQDYIEAYCQAKLGNSQKHQQLLDIIQAYTLKHWTNLYHGAPTNNAAGIYIGAETLQKSGQKDKADQLIQNWKTRQDSLHNWRISQGSASPQAQWVFAAFKNQKNASRQLREKIQSEKKKDTFQLFLESMDLINQK